MSVWDKLNENLIHLNIIVPDKTELLQRFARNFTNFDKTLPEDELFRLFIQREGITSTGLGHGLAVPHARLTQIMPPIIDVILLKKPVNYNAIDKKPVDIAFAIVGGEGYIQEYLNLLSSIAKLMRNNANLINVMRQLTSNRQLIKLIRAYEETLPTLPHF